jgi:hypothetical protein
VTCAICQHNYSKHCVEVGFCDECKCYVCGACNCSVFHLSYQVRAASLHHPNKLRGALFWTIKI